MQAVVLCAGKSTRTYPLTVDRPKTLLKVMNKTILEHNLEQLQGIVDGAIIVIGHYGEKIKELFGEKYKNIKLIYFEQKEQLGTGYAILQVKDLLKDKFIVINGDDLYHGEDILKCSQHRYAVLCNKVDDPSQFGVFEIDNGYVRNIIEKPKQLISDMANTGLYILDKKIFNYEIKKSVRGEYEIIDYIKELAKQNEVRAEQVSKYWLPIVYPWDMLNANEFFLNNIKENKIDGFIDKNATIKGNTIIGKETKILPGVYIEGNTMIGENCVIGPNCYIRGSNVIGDNCHIGHAVEIKSSVIGNNTKIKHLSLIGDSVISDNVNIGAGTIVANLRHDNKNIKVMVNGEERALSSIGDDEVIRLVNEGELRTADMRDIMAYGSLTRESNKEMAKETLSARLGPVFSVADTYKLKMTHEEGVKSLLGQGIGIQSVAKKQREVLVDVGMLSDASAQKMQVQAEKFYPGMPASDITKKVAAKDEFVVVEVPSGTTIETIEDGKRTRKEKYGGSVLYVPVKQTSGDKYSLDGDKQGFVIASDGNVKEVVDKNDMNAIMSKLEVGSFTKISKGLCLNKYSNAHVRYFETEPYKGMPSLVPVDVNKGWYAATKQILPGFGMKPAQQSGIISSLWLCNVGKNGREEWDSSVSDDKPCIQINYDTGQPLNQLSCLEEGEAQRLALKAKKIMEQAYSQYGKKRIVLDSGSFEAKAALKTTGTQCEDFMSASDCNLLFNVCDPVMCPSSRCNFGGTFPVDDVIQSGIFGSIALCLPNFGMPSNGGVVVPVCLSGVHAGLDAYVSILKSMRDCYAENIKSGKYVGICDEVYSIYLCECFWKQAALLAD